MGGAQSAGCCRPAVDGKDDKAPDSCTAIVAEEAPLTRATQPRCIEEAQVAVEDPCQAGQKVPAEPAQEESGALGLTATEMLAIEVTWQQAAALGVEDVGVIFYRQIFDIAPEALQLFSFKDEPDLYNSPKLKKHAVIVMNTVSTAVGALRTPETLVPVLTELGVKHVGYSVLPAHYDVVGQALLRTLKLGLEKQITEDVERAWTKLWGVIATTMIGSNYDGKQDEPPPPPELVSEGPLTAAEVAAVERSWSRAASLGTEAVGVMLFRNIFEIAPSALQMFPFKDDVDVYESEELKKHGLRVINTLSQAVAGLRNFPELVPVLQELGTKHVAYSVQAPHYDVVGQATIKTLKTGLGREFTPEVEAAWLKLWPVVANAMKGEHYQNDQAQTTATGGGPLSEAEICVIENSWAKAASLGVETVGVLLFKQIFELAPEALHLFKFKDEPDLYESAELKKHATGVVTTVGTAVESLRNLTALVPVLQELGLKHVSYGVLEPHYDVVGQALLKTLNLGLAQDFTTEVGAAWSKLWGIIVPAMTKGNYTAGSTQPTADEKKPTAKSTKAKSDDEAVLTKAEVASIRKSWAKAAELGVETVGVLLFKNIFDIAPSAINLFPFKDLEGDIYESDSLKKHATKVVETVATAVSLLNKMDQLVPVLQELGTKHVGYGVMKPHYDVVGQATLRTLKMGLAEGFTKEVEVAWTKLWGIVAKVMMGSHYPEPAEKKKASSKKMASTKKAGDGPLSQAEISAIEASWKKAENLGVENVGVLLFKQIFEIAPAALQLFDFKDEPDLYGSEKLKMHATQVVITVGEAVASIRNIPALVPTLQELGLKHVGYNVLPEHYDVVGQATIKTLKLGLSDEFTPEAEAAWGKLWGLIAKTMIGDRYASSKASQKSTPGAKKKATAKKSSSNKKSTDSAGNGKARQGASSSGEAASGEKQEKRVAPRRTTLSDSEVKEMTASLLAAAKEGKTAEVEGMLAQGLNVNAADTDGNTALHLAAQEGNIQTVQALLAAGADPSLAIKLGEWGNTPLHFAAKGGHKDVVEALVSADKKGKALRVKNRQGKTPAEVATGKARSILKKVVAQQE